MFRQKKKLIPAFSISPKKADLNVFTFLKEKNLLGDFLESRHSQNLTEEDYQAIFSLEFDITLPEECNSVSSCMQIMHERELFNAYLVSESVSLADVNLNLLREWAECVLMQETLHAFLSKFQQAVAKLGEHDQNNSNSFRQLRDYNDKLFCDLIHNPTQMETDVLNDCMKLLCRINASYTINLIFKLHPELKVNLTLLLREAISALHTQAANALLEAGADIHQYVIHSNYGDYGYQFFCSPLFYVLLLPFEPYSAVGRLGVRLEWDNVRLSKMVDFLISQGARPEQNCIFTDSEALTVETAKEKEEQQLNCVTLAADALKKIENSNPDVVTLTLINKLANWEQASLDHDAASSGKNESRLSLTM